MEKKNIFLIGLILLIAGLLNCQVSAKEYGADVLDGIGDFETVDDRAGWTLHTWSGDSALNKFDSELPHSGDWSWYFGPSTDYGNTWGGWTTTPVITLPNREYCLRVYVRSQISTPSWINYVIGGSGWQSLSYYTTAWGYNEKYYTTGTTENTMEVAFKMHANSANDNGYIDDVTLHREKCIPSPNAVDSLNGILPYGERVVVSIYCDEGTEGIYTKNFDPDITVTSPYAIIHSTEYISDRQIDVNLTAIYGGNIYLTLRNEYSELESIHTMQSTTPSGPFTLDSNEFPIIFFSMTASPSGGHFELARTCGATHLQTWVQCREPVSQSISQLQTYLDDCEQNNLKLMVNLYLRKWAKEPSGLSDLEQIATAVKDHNSLGFWFLVDEPENKDLTAAEIAPFYNMLKNLTPSIPISTTHCMGTYTFDGNDYHWSDYIGVQDILMPGASVVHDEPFPTAPLGILPNFIKQVKQFSGNVFMPILQTYNRLYWGVGTWPAITENCRYPNTLELRYWSYATIIQGARGQSWYGYYQSIHPEGSEYPVDNTWAERILRPVGQEIRKFTYLVSPAHQPDVILDGSVGHNDLYMAVWPRETGTWAVLVNGLSSERGVTIDTSSQISEAILVPWGDGRSVEAQIANGQLKINLKPWEALVWKVKKAADINRDDYVDILDVQEMTDQWLNSTKP